MTAESERLEEARRGKAAWKKWGPYLSERQWGTVREDYSDNGDAWNHFPHDHARSRAYRWGEDGIAGVSDDQQRICLALALWNGKDPILKERLFGLTNSEGNHGEDVKEYYFYLDSTPTHSYMKYLYKYPQAAYPYGDIVKTNRERSRQQPEYELLDTGVFDQDRYFDVFVEYAKATPEDLLMQVTVHNRGPEKATLAPAADRLVPEHLVVGRGRRAAVAAAGRPRREGLGDRAQRRGARHALPVRRRRGRPALHRERDEQRAPVRDAQPDALRQGRLRPLPRPRRAERRQPGAHGDEGGGPLHARGRGGEVGDAAPAALRGRAGADDRALRRLRGDDGGAAAGGRRVLRHGDPGLARRGRGPRDAPGARRHDVVEAVLQLRPRRVARRARRRSVRPAARRPAQRPLAPHGERRRHLDARQVGIPVVRGLGPRVPRARAHARRRGLRQGAARPDAAGPLPAPERSDPRVRVELRRREPPGPRLGHDLHLPPRAGAARAGRPRLARALVPEAGAELHLVGEPQGPQGQERLRGRLPRARQHRRLRPQRAAADRRLPRAGRRHGLDGALLPEHARDRRAARAREAGLCRRCA